MEEELAAVKGARGALAGVAGAAEVGVCINWARSVLEARSEERVVEHLKAALVERALFGLIFSGCSGGGGRGGRSARMAALGRTLTCR